LIEQQALTLSSVKPSGCPWILRKIREPEDVGSSSLWSWAYPHSVAMGV
jgi:hypothetical protein